MLGDLSLTPFILLAQVGAWVWIVRRARLSAGISDEVERDAVALACLLLIWAAGLSAAALAGLLRLPTVAGLAPVLWLGLVPYLLVALSIAVLPTLRIQSLRLLDRTPAWLLPLLQSLRLLALASLWPLYAQLGGDGLWRAMNTEPLPFALAGLDLLYGLSALPVAFLVAKSKMGPRSQVAWLVLGALLLLVPRLGPMDQSLGLAFSYFYLPLDPQGLLGYPQVLNYGLIGPGFVLLAMWQVLWLVRRDLARRTLPLGAQPPEASRNGLGVMGRLTGLSAPMQAALQRRRHQRAERRQAQQNAKQQRAQAAAKKAAEKKAARTQAKSAKSMPEASDLPPALPPTLEPLAAADSPTNLAERTDLPPLNPHDAPGHEAHNLETPKEEGEARPPKRSWLAGFGKRRNKGSSAAGDQPTAQPTAQPGPQTGTRPANLPGAAGETTAEGNLAASDDQGFTTAAFGAPPPPLPGHEDLDFDTSPFQIEPLPERAWSKAHDLNAEPDIPFADPLVPTNVAPLPSEVPPPAPPPLDPIFEADQTKAPGSSAGQDRGQAAAKDASDEEPRGGS